jgi:predicted nucleotidyltransferase
MVEYNGGGPGMDLPEKIADLDARKVREMFKTFLEREIEVEWKDGLPVRNVRRMTPSLIEAELGVPPAEAELIQAKLISERYVEPEKFTPTRLGMALAQHSDRAKISRADAEAILTQVLGWADRTNAVPDARVKVKTIHLYGSLERGAAEVSDIDLFIEFTTMDLELDLTPEDQQREEELAQELVTISEYLSPSSFIDRMLMEDVPMRQVFPR